MSTSRFARLGATAVLLTTVVLATTGQPGAAAAKKAAIGEEVVKRLRAAPARPVRVLLKGEVAAVRQAAARVGLDTERELDEFVVVFADAAQVDALSLDPAVELVAGDLQVSTLMTVADRVMAADRVRAGDTSLLGPSYQGVSGKGRGCRCGGLGHFAAFRPGRTEWSPTSAS